MKREQNLETLEKVVGGNNDDYAEEFEAQEAIDDDWAPQYGLDSQPCGKCHNGTVFHTQVSFGPFERYYCNNCNTTWDL